MIGCQGWPVSYHFHMSDHGSDETTNIHSFFSLFAREGDFGIRLRALLLARPYTYASHRNQKEISSLKPCISGLRLNILQQQGESPLVVDCVDCRASQSCKGDTRQVEIGADVTQTNLLHLPFSAVSQHPCPTVDRADIVLAQDGFIHPQVECPLY